MCAPRFPRATLKYLSHLFGLFVVTLSDSELGTDLNLKAAPELR